MSGATRLGFGCASLGSRISEREGAVALRRAFDAGVTWFDVAPAYGDGAAERVLGEFARGKRDDIVLCTKVGIQPPTLRVHHRLFRPVARRLLAAAPGLRGTVQRRRPRARPVALDGAIITASVDASLARMGVERVDILALHDVDADVVVRDDVLRALDRVCDAGKVGRASIASSAIAVRTGIARSQRYEVAQVAHNPFSPGLFALADLLIARSDIDRVVHSVFGASRLVTNCADIIARTPHLASAMAEAGYRGLTAKIAADLLLDFALVSNAGGVILVSMFAPNHLAQAVARAALPRDPATVTAVTKALVAAAALDGVTHAG